MKNVSHTPFGQADCESELKALKSDYSELYFEETPFNKDAIKPQTYLIIGRRGSGKTALAQYFSFQQVIKNPIYIDVDEPKVYQQVLSDIASRASESREIAIPRLQKVWEYVIWCVIFEHTRADSQIIAEACDETCSTSGVSHLINSIIDRLLILLHDSSDKIIDERIEKLLSDERLDVARAEVLKIASKRPIIVAFDTLEKYDISNDALMNAMAALVQCAADFNLHFREEGVHLKVFISGEVFPYLKEDVLQNPLKSIKSPVYLFWRPKDLLRLISWRFFCYLEANNLLFEKSKGEINWLNHHEVLEKMWIPYFGQFITNARGLKEHTFSYVLRHTQMRPRQLILLCNAIAVRATETGGFPYFSEKDILYAIKDAETDLAIEIINSFSQAYKNVGTIVDALMKIPMLFKGNELDKRARQSASEWPSGDYSPAKFRRLVAELGIVGRVRRHNEEVGFTDADFEYSLRERLPITHNDECVIHPMFYSRFNVEFNSLSRVMPFSTERDGQEANVYFP
jgi:AAA+ ATPase superfamily predicted ATPase